MLKKSLKNWNYHNPVQLDTAVEYLRVQKGQRYIDATLGSGGHAGRVIDEGGIVLGIDQDQEAIQACPDLESLTKVLSNFEHLETIAREYKFIPVSGILFDLGVSEHQFDTAYRGFSLQQDGPLDMRMGNSAITAAELVNQLSTVQLASLFDQFGEIPTAKSLAAKIVANRPMTTTGQLAMVCGKWARQAFQALRIAVNDELGALERALPQALSVLAPGGRIVVISFHSLEDRLVKQTFQKFVSSGTGEIITPNPILGEKKSKLRAFEKNK